MGSLGIEVGTRLKAVHFAQRHHQRLRLASMVTRRFPLDDLAGAVGSRRTGQAIKAVVEPTAST
jgi:Zn-dependent alcohol dehydrogenase